jgi:hypothetical protein
MYHAYIDHVSMDEWCIPALGDDPETKGMACEKQACLFL